MIFFTELVKSSMILIQGRPPQIIKSCQGKIILP